jgi:hypothetical protein
MYIIKMDNIQKLSNVADSYVKQGLSNPYIMAVLKLTLAMYAAQLAPRLPTYITGLFNNVFVKLLSVFLIAYLADKDFQLAILLAVIYVFGSNLLSGRGVFETFSDFNNAVVTDGKFTLIEPKSVIYPGCQKITMKDLEEAFDGDHMKLQNTVMYSYQELLNKLTSSSAKENLMKMAYAVGLPYNMALDKEENAPYIASLLMYNGFVFGKDCQAPH